MFLHPSQAEVDAVIDALQPDWVQTDLQDLDGLRLPPGQRVLPVLRKIGAEPLFGGSRAMLDGGTSGAGVRADWTAARALASRCELVLAGGLDAGNVAEAIRAVRPFGVDVSSGVERARGVKDPARIRDFIDAARRRGSGIDGGGGETLSANSTGIDRDRLLAEMLRGAFPDARGRFGPYGGRYVPETLVPALDRLEAGVRSILADRAFRAEFESELRGWAGRPTPLTRAHALSRRWGAEVWLKREDLAHTGAHKINNAIGQALLAKRLGARRIVAETGAGQHGVASAAACARLGMPCVVYMGEVDMERQAPNVGRMKLLGAEVVPVTSGDRTLRAAIDEALRDWVGDPDGTYYLLGSAVGPHPYPYLVREFQSVIGIEARAQMLDATGQAARYRGRLRGRRLERDRPVPSVRRRPGRRAARSRGRRERQRSRTERSLARLRHARRAAGQLLAAAAGSARPDPGDAFRLSRARLPGRRTRARAAESDRSRQL